MKNHREYKTLFPVTQLANTFSVDGDASITKLNTDAKKLTLAEHLAQLVADCILGFIFPSGHRTRQLLSGGSARRMSKVSMPMCWVGTGWPVAPSITVPKHASAESQ